MGTYTKANLRDVENQAPKFDMPNEMEARFARRAIGGETLGLSLFTLAPNFRIRSTPRWRGAGGTTSWRSGKRKLDRERRTGTGARREDEVAAHPSYELARDVEAESGPAR
jgi:hypothetical protein